MSPWSTLTHLWHSVVEFFTPENTISVYQEVLNQLMMNRSHEFTTRNPLLRLASDLWRQGVDPELFIVLLSEKKRELEMRNLDVIQVLKNLAKYPPALGMTGTVVGMMGLFADLDKNKDTIGRNLSLALTATFLGLILANLIISPLGDRMQVHKAKMQQLNTHLFEILLLINRGESKVLIQGAIYERAS